MALEQKRAAFFDVDNTLIRGSSLYFLGRGMYQRGYFTKADISRFVLANLRFRLTGTEKKEEIVKFQNAATSFIGGHNVQEIQKLGEEIYDEFVSPSLWQGTIEIAQAHLADGVEVWLVTAAPEDMATLIAKRLGFDDVIATDLATDSTGHVLARIDGHNCYDAAKLERVKGWMEAHGLSRENCHIRAYSDHVSDAPLLSYADEPFATNPHGPLARLAATNGWPILDWRDPKA